MRLWPERRAPWDPPRWRRLRRLGSIAAVVLLLVLLAGVFVNVVQPVAYRVAGQAVLTLGGGDRAGEAVIVAVYLVAATTAFAWVRLLDNAGPRRSTVLAGLVALPIWVGAIALTPPSRDGEDAQRIINNHVDDAALGATLDHSVTVGLILVLIAAGIWFVYRRFVPRNPHQDRWTTTKR